jgi:predicted glutamine amidotransferase
MRSTTIRAIIGISLLSLLIFSKNASSASLSNQNHETSDYEYWIAQDDSGHNCSMWAAIGETLATGMIHEQLVELPNSLRFLSRAGNTDGWGIVSYSHDLDSVSIIRGALTAYNDSSFDSAAIALDFAGLSIVLAHIRNCTAGCCCHECQTIPNPHPFVRFKSGKWWTFEHNGQLSKSALYRLIGSEYLANNPPSGSGLSECDPSDTASIIDSELYFLLLMSQIEAHNWDVARGVVETVRLILIADRRARLNFVLSDGQNIWASRKGASLYFDYDFVNNCGTVATKYPDSLQGNWQLLDDYMLLSMNLNAAPIVTDLDSMLGICDYIPGDMDGDRAVMGNDILYGVRYLKGLGGAPPDSCYNDSIPGGHWLYSSGDVNGNCELRASDITRLVACFRGTANIEFCPLILPR